MSAALSQPSRIVKHALGTALAGLGFVTLVWQPIAAKRAIARATLTEGQAIGLHSPITDPAALITASASRARLTIRSIGKHGAGTRVVIEDADFSRALDWLARLDGEGLQVSSLAVERRAQPGHVSIDVTLVES